jgi:2-desacetyl-2-hydroxyethyl bacteriochlorophyllide A dehydrogenase
MSTMTGLFLPGNSTIEFREVPIPEPGPGQVLLKMKASSICGSDIRAIYREHLGKGPEAYQGVIAGHEPCGQVFKVGPNTKRFVEGDRVVVYHISGCGVCHDCRMGYQISCTSDLRAAYGWQRDGGHAEYMLADEADLVKMPDSMSFQDGALCACGFGTCYEALERIKLSGNDRLLVVGLGPVGMAALMLGRAMGATKLIGVDSVPERVQIAEKMGLLDVALTADDNALDNIKDATDGHGAEAVIDCSGNPNGRFLAIQGTRQWGRCAFVGEGNSVSFEPSRDIIHKQITIYGSWVTSVPHMEDLVEKIARWGIHPDKTVTHTFPLDKAAEAYQLMDQGKCGKVVITWDE